MQRPMAGQQVAQVQRTVRSWATTLILSILLVVVASSSVALGRSEGSGLSSSESQDQHGTVWIAEVGGTLRLATVDGRLVGEFPLDESALAVAVDPLRGNVWVLTQSRILVLDFEGHERWSRVVGETDGTADIVVAEGDGSAWFRAGQSLWNLGADGQLFQRTRLDEAPVALLPSRSVGAVRAVTNRRILDLDARSGAFLMERQAKPGESFRAASLDDGDGVVWVATEDVVYRFRDHVDPEIQVRLPGVAHLVPDGSSGVWAAQGGDLIRIGADGEVVARVEAFTPGLTVTELARADDGTLWAASSLGLAKIAANGKVEFRVFFDPPIVLHDLAVAGPLGAVGPGRGEVPDERSGKARGDEIRTGASPAAALSAGPGAPAESQSLPPDPSAIATPIDPTVTHDLYRETQFLWEGTEESGAIQLGVQPGAIERKRVAVIRGKVVDRSGVAMPGVKVEIRGRSDYGYTLSRSDGEYDIALNGGGKIAVRFSMDGYLTLQRRLSPRWQATVNLPEVAMTPVSGQHVDLASGANAATMVAGAVETDDSGPRQTRLFFPAQTVGTMVMPNGDTQSLSNMRVTATEYTVGEFGEEAMPGDLPLFSGYTYAFEARVEEAEAAGAVSVTFDKPVMHYVDNFLDFPLGEPVPTGYYDRELEQWVPSEDGLVIAIVGVDGQGRAEIAVDETMVAADLPTLEALGFTDDERSVLWSTYQGNVSLWRVALSHFTPWDCNWPFTWPDDAVYPPDAAEGAEDQLDDSCEEEGSVIECETQVIREDIPLVGVPFGLHYSSVRAPGRKTDHQLTVQVSGASVPDSLETMFVKAEVLGTGKIFGDSFDAAPNKTWLFEWDGTDRYGRQVYGTFEVGITVTWLYPAMPTSGGPGNGGGGFGEPGGRILSDQDRGRIAFQRSEIRYVTNALPAPLAGWSITPHHAYDTKGKKVWRGDGTRTGFGLVGEPSILILGDGSDSTDDGAPALDASIGHLEGAAVGPDGTIYFADNYNHKIIRLNTDGIAWTVADNIDWPTDVAVGPAGDLFVCSDDGGNGSGHEILRIDSNGVVHEVLANSQCQSLLITEHRMLYTRELDDRVWTFNREGETWPLDLKPPEDAEEDDGTCFSTWNSVYALKDPRGLAVDLAGFLLITDGACLKRALPNGYLATVAGTGTQADEGDGGPALEASFKSLRDVVVGTDGSIYVLDGSVHRIRKIQGGRITAFAGTGRSGNGDPAANGLATTVAMNIDSMTLDQHGRMVVAGGGSAGQWNGEARLIVPRLPGDDVNEDGQILVPSPDGEEIYVFDIDGRHHETWDAHTGTAVWTFTYDDGRLETVADAFGNETQIVWNGGAPTMIVGPYGHQTTLGTDSNGWVDSIVNPAGEEYGFLFTEEGLISGMNDPEGHDYIYDFDGATGRIQTAIDPLLGGKTLERTDENNITSIAHSTPLGRTTTYQLESLDQGGRQRTVIQPDGATTVSVLAIDGKTSTTTADDTTVSVTEGWDPRFGFTAPIPAKTTFDINGGPTVVTTFHRSIDLEEHDDPMSFTNITDTTTTNGRESKTVYTKETRTYETTSAMGRVYTTSLTEDGLVAEIEMPGFAPVVFDYDNRGRL